MNTDQLVAETSKHTIGHCLQCVRQAARGAQIRHVLVQMPQTAKTDVGLALPLHIRPRSPRPSLADSE